MKKIGILINQKRVVSNLVIGAKDVFYVFEKIIKQEYGIRGVKNLKPTFFKNGKIFVKSENSVFASELLLSKNEIIQKINQEIGKNEIVNIKIN